jgi:hypothetical protein
MGNAVNMRAVLIVCAGLMAASCSRSDTAPVQHDLNAVGHDLSAEANKVAHDPALKQAGTELRAVGHDTASATRKAAGEVRTTADQTAATARDRTHRAAADLRGASDDRQSRAGG